MDQITHLVRTHLLEFSKQVAIEFSLTVEEVDWCLLDRPHFSLEGYERIFGGIFQQYTPEEFSLILRYRYNCSPALLPLFEKVRECVRVIDTFLGMLLRDSEEKPWMELFRDQENTEKKAIEYLRHHAELISFSSCVPLLKLAEETSSVIQLYSLNKHPRTVIGTWCQHGCLSALQFLVPKIRYGISEITTWLRTSYYFSHPEVFLYLLEQVPAPFEFLFHQCHLEYLPMLYPREFLRVVEGLREKLITRPETRFGVFPFEDLVRGVSVEYLEKNPGVLDREFEWWTRQINEDYIRIGRANTKSAEQFFRLVPESILLRVYNLNTYVLITVVTCLFRTRPEIFAKYKATVSVVQYGQEHEGEEEGHDEERTTVFPLREKGDLRKITIQNLDDPVMLCFESRHE